MTPTAQPTQAQFHQERNIITATLNNIQLAEGWEESDPTVRHKTAFPLFGAMGTETSLVIGIELEPGYALGRHTDSTEEVFLVLQGDVEIEVNGTRTQRSQGDILVAPKLAPHSIRNIGTEMASVLGFFGSANIVSTFENIVMPEGMRVFDTAQFQ